MKDRRESNVNREVKLVKYDAACRAISEARRIDEVKNIRDVSIALRAYAKQAHNHELESDAIEIRMRATRRMDQMRQEQKATVGLAKGGRPYQRKATGGTNPPVATLADAGIGKDLAKEGRRLGAMSDDQFEQEVTQARAHTISLAEVAERADRPVAARQRVNITDTPEPQKPRKQLTIDDLLRAAAERFPEWLREVARQIGGFEPAAETAALLPAKPAKQADEDAERIMRFLDEFRRARRDLRRELKPGLKVVGRKDGEGAAE